MGGRTSSYAVAGIVLEFTAAHKPLTQQQSAFDKATAKQEYLNNQRINCSGEKQYCTD
jgi:hypothetical protein